MSTHETQMSETETHPRGEACTTSLRCLCGSLFRGPLRWLSIVGVVYGVAFAALAIVSAAMFFSAGTVRAQIGWAVGFAVSMALLGMTEMWFWNFAWRNSLAARLDRLESRLAEHAERSAAEHDKSAQREEDMATHVY